MIILLISRAISGGKKPKTVDLSTNLDGSSWDEYPRAQMKRESYISLCGEWELAVRYDSESVEDLGKIKEGCRIGGRTAGLGVAKIFPGGPAVLRELQHTFVFTQGNNCGRLCRAEMAVGDIQGGAFGDGQGQNAGILVKAIGNVCTVVAFTKRKIAKVQAGTVAKSDADRTGIHSGYLFDVVF